MQWILTRMKMMNKGENNKITQYERGFTYIDIDFYAFNLEVRIAYFSTLKVKQFTLEDSCLAR